MCANSIGPVLRGNARPPGPARRDGVARREGDPQLLGLREALRAPGSDVRPDRLVDAPRPSVPGLRMVGAMREAVEAHELHAAPPTEGPWIPSAPRQAPADLRVDGHHLDPAPGGGQLG